MYRKKYIIAVLCLMGLFFLAGASAQLSTKNTIFFSGKSVYISNENVNITLEPSTSYGTGWVYVNITDKKKSVDNNLFVRTDSPYMSAGKLQVYNPHTETNHYAYDCKQSISIKDGEFMCYYTDTVNGSAHQSIIYKHRYDSQDKTMFYWDEYVYKTWDEPIYPKQVLDNGQYVYIYENVYISGSLSLRFWLNTPAGFSSEGKYDYGLYESLYGYDSRTGTGNKYIDPYFNTTYGECRSIIISAPQGAGYVHKFYLTSSNIDYSITDGTDLMFVEGTCTAPTGASPLNYYRALWNESGISEIYVNVSSANESYIAMYYNNTNAPDMSSLENTFYYKHQIGFENETLTATPAGWNKGVVVTGDSRLDGYYLNKTADETSTNQWTPPSSYPYYYAFKTLLTASSFSGGLNYWFETEGGNHQYIFGLNSNFSSWCDGDTRYYNQVLAPNSEHWVEINITASNVGYMYVDGVAMPNCNPIDSRDSSQGDTLYLRGVETSYPDSFIGYSIVNGINYYFSSPENPSGGGGGAETCYYEETGTGWVALIIPSNCTLSV